MFDQWKDLVPADFANESRVWIYQSSRKFHLNEALHIESLLEDFTSHWQSHGAKVKGYANLFFGQFVVVMADETGTGVSGCSTDSSVRIIKEIENLFGVSMFDRLALAFVLNDKVEMLPLSQVKYAAEKGFLNPDTLYFNNLVQTKADLLSRWLIPVKESWLSSRLPQIA